MKLSIHPFGGSFMYGTPMIFPGYSDIPMNFPWFSSKALLQLTAFQHLLHRTAALLQVAPGFRHGAVGQAWHEAWGNFYGSTIYIYMYMYMSGGQNYLFTVIATGKTGSFPIGCEDFRSLITSSSKCCS